MEKLEQAKKLLGFVKNKELAIFQELNQINDELQGVNESFGGINLANLEQIKGEQGEQGIQGETGPQGDIGPQGPQGEPGYTPIKGIDYNDGEPGRTPEAGVDFDVPDEARIIESIIDLVPKPKDGSPDSPEEVRSKLESLEGEERLDAFAIKNLPQYIKEKGKEILVGGIRFLENLADVSVTISDKRQDLLIQYDTTNKRWQDGIALSVGAVAPTNPKLNDLWIDSS